jgi:hypothetical protein
MVNISALGRGGRSHHFMGSEMIAFKGPWSDQLSGSIQSDLKSLGPGNNRQSDPVE